MEKKELLYEGKAKKVYATEDPAILLVDYKDDATAFNGLKKGTISGKGAINNRGTNYMMQLLETQGVPTHFVKELSDRQTLVKKVSIVPLEVIIRNISAGSFAKRFGVEEGIVFDEPTNGLDIPSKAQFRSALMKYTSEDSTIIISTHQVRDLENIIDPIIILDKQDVLMNASIEEISRKLYFDYGTQIHPESLYSEQLPGGFIQVYPNAEGLESKVNIEALFNAVHKNKELIKGLFPVASNK